MLFGRRVWLALLCAVVALAIGCVWRVAHNNYRVVMQEFAPWRNGELLDHPERAGIENLQEVVFASADSTRIAGWYVPSRNHAAVILAHGATADRTTLLAEIKILAERGFGVLAIDWPGHGNSGGVDRQGRSERDALVAGIDWLEKRDDVDPKRIGAYGFSIGGYLTAQVASYDSRLRALVFAGTPGDYVAYTDRVHSKWGALSRWPARLALQRAGMPVEELRPFDVISAISPRPILFLSGTNDADVPADMVRSLFDRAGQPKELWIVEHAAHGNYSQVARQQYAQRLGDFFTKHLLN